MEARGDFPRDTEIADTQFRKAIEQINARSRKNECRIVVTMRDEAGLTSEAK